MSGDSGSYAENRTFRTPERFELVVGAFGLILCAMVWGFTRSTSDLAINRFALDACCIAISVCVLGGSFVTLRRYQIAALTVHALATVILVFAFREAGPVTAVLLLISLQLHFALRVPIPWAVPAHVVSISFLSLFPLSLAHSAPERIEVVVVGVVMATLAETTVFYRERLVADAHRISAQSRSLESLAAANQSFVAHLESVKAEAAETERLLITRELHDCVGYALTNITMMMNAAQYVTPDEVDKFREYCVKTRELAANTLQESREILYRLRSIAAQGTPPSRAFFTRLCRDFAEATGVKTECHLGNLPETIPEGAFNVLFRTVQVGFINALRHGNTRHLSLAFWLSEEEMRTSIWNDVPGRVVKSQGTAEGIGLRGIRERLEMLNGSMQYGQVGNGYQLNVYIPREEFVDGAD